MKLKTYLKRHELTQSDFAHRIGVEQGVVSRWCNGRIPDSLFVAKIARATRGAVTMKDWLTVARQAGSI